MPKSMCMILRWVVFLTQLLHYYSTQTNCFTIDEPLESEETITCYTCVNVANNFMCNRYAIDRPCPLGMEFCHTLHIMDSTGESIVVHKKCTDDHECTPDRVGCFDIDTQRFCVACCDEMYCNNHVPTNYSNAVYENPRTSSRLLSNVAVQSVRYEASVTVFSVACSLLSWYGFTHSRVWS